MLNKIAGYIRPYLDGAAHMFDFAGSLKGSPVSEFYRRADLTPQQKDAIALAGDWRTVGEDLEHAINSESAPSF